MRRLDARIEPLLAQLGNDPRLPPGAEDNIRQAIAESPFLSELLANAASDGKIGRIAVSYGQNNGGHFQAGENGQPGTIHLSESTFRDWRGTARIDVLTEIMGHETMHGVLTKNRENALELFSKGYRTAMEDAHQARESTVDLTPHVRTYLDLGRQDEALAEVAGLRALNSRLKHLDPAAPETVIESRLVATSTSRCMSVDDGTKGFAPGLSYESLTKPPFAGGHGVTKAVEQCFYDGKGTLGKHADSDYRNYYGVDPLARIARDYDYLAGGRKPPEVRIDLHELGLDPRQLERNGLDLGRAKILSVVDRGENGLGWVELKNTAARERHNESSPNRTTVSPDANGLQVLSEPDQRLLDQIRGNVGALDKANGRNFDETSERISASLLATAKEAGLHRVDHVLLSKQTDALPAAHYLFVVQGDPANPASVRAHIQTSEAAQRPLQESLSQAAAMDVRPVVEQVMEQQQTQERQARAASPSM